MGLWQHNLIANFWVQKGENMSYLLDAARFIADLRWADLPGAVKKAAKDCVIDTVGVAIGAWNDDLLRKVSANVLAYSGNSQTASVWGTNLKTDARTAALLNGMASHTLELDDVHTSSKTHIGTVVVPAAWAIAEQLQKSSEELLTAVVCAYEITARVGMTLGVSNHRNKGWHATSTAGCFGAAAAVAKLMDFSPEQIVSALGMGGTQSFGVWAFLEDGATCKRMHPGRAAANGLDAAVFAQGGMTGPEHILEASDGGLLAAMTDEGEIEYITKGLGERWEICNVDRKLYPCCRSTHAAIDIAIAMRNEWKFSAEDIEKIIVETYLVGNKQCGMSESSRSPQTAHQARFSIPYTVAAAIIDGEITLKQFDEAHLALEPLRSLMHRVEVQTDDVLTELYPDHWGSRLNIFLKDGFNCNQLELDSFGSVSKPLDESTLKVKVVSLMQTTLGNTADSVYEKLQAMPKLVDLPDLSA